MSQSKGLSMQEFLAPVRAALGRKGPLTTPPVPPAVPDELVRLTKADADLPALFTTNAKAVGMDVRPVAAGDLIPTIISVLTEVKAASVALTVDRLPEARTIEQAARAAGLKIIPWRGDDTMEPHFIADASVTDVHAALAETGTLICNSDADHSRGCSLAVPTHIAIVRRQDLVPDMLDYTATLAGLTPAQLPSAQAFITGPSKTADIEGVLITGVHGPGKVIILLVA